MATRAHGYPDSSPARLLRPQRSRPVAGGAQYRKGTSSGSWVAWWLVPRRAVWSPSHLVDLVGGAGGACFRWQCLLAGTGRLLFARSERQLGAGREWRTMRQQQRYRVCLRAIRLTYAMWPKNRLRSPVAAPRAFGAAARSSPILPDACGMSAPRSMTVSVLPPSPVSTKPWLRVHASRNPQPCARV